MTVRTRIAPSPTGDPHVGTAYIALFNLIFAKKNNGKFILRIEDTDLKRSRPAYEQNIYEALRWCNITWDEGPDIGGEYGPYRQSDRLKIYQEYIKILLDNGTAYKCFATEEELKQMREEAEKKGLKRGYDRRYRDLSKEEVLLREKRGESYVVRLKVPLEGECVFEDQIKGVIKTPWADIDDQIILKSNGFPTYHFAHAVDDYLMKITHIIRGDEWISSTPKHILIYQSFGWKLPIFMHMPLLLSPGGKKLSKRKNPTSIFYYRDCGYLPEAMANFLTLMGYSMPNNQEIYSFEEITKAFDPTRIGTSGAIFDIKKLDWLNQHYIINTLSDDDILAHLEKRYFNKEFLKKLIPLSHQRMKTFGEFMQLNDFFFINNVHLSHDLLCPKELADEKAIYLLQGMLLLLEAKEDWTKESIEQTSHELAELFKIDHKKIIMPLLFVAIMGKISGPPFFASCEILGKDLLRARILKAIEFLGGISSKKMDLLQKCLFDKKSCETL
jgi:glutamyl-tRNA synthetase